MYHIFKFFSCQCRVPITTDAVTSLSHLVRQPSVVRLGVSQLRRLFAWGHLSPNFEKKKKKSSSNDVVSALD